MIRTYPSGHIRITTYVTFVRTVSRSSGHIRGTLSSGHMVRTYASGHTRQDICICPDEHVQITSGHTVRTYTYVLTTGGICPDDMSWRSYVLTTGVYVLTTAGFADVATDTVSLYKNSLQPFHMVRNHKELFIFSKKKLLDYRNLKDLW